MKYSLSLFSCLLFITLCAPIICGDDQTEKSITPKSNTQNQNSISNIEFNHSTNITDEDLKIEDAYKTITELIEGFEDVDLEHTKQKKCKACLQCIIL